MDVTNVPRHVADIAEEFGYTSKYDHDGNGHIFHLKDESGKKRANVEFSLSDQDCVNSDIIQLKQAIKERIEGGERGVNSQSEEDKNKAKAQDSKLHEAKVEEAALDKSDKPKLSSNPNK